MATGGSILPWKMTPQKTSKLLKDLSQLQAWIDITNQSIHNDPSWRDHYIMASGFGAGALYLEWSNDNTYLKGYPLSSSSTYRGKVLGAIDLNFTDAYALSVNALPPLKTAYVYPRSFQRNGTNIQLNSFQLPVTTDIPQNRAYFLLHGWIEYETKNREKIRELRTFKPVHVDNVGSFKLPEVGTEYAELYYKASQIDVVNYLIGVEIEINVPSLDLNLSSDLTMIRVDIDENGRIPVAWYKWSEELACYLTPSACYNTEDPCPDLPTHGICDLDDGFMCHGGWNKYFKDADGNTIDLKDPEDYTAADITSFVMEPTGIIPNQVGTYDYFVFIPAPPQDCEKRAQLGVSNIYDGKLWYFDPFSDTPTWQSTNLSSQTREGDVWYTQITPVVFSDKTWPKEGAFCFYTDTGSIDDWVVVRPAIHDNNDMVYAYCKHISGLYSADPNYSVVGSGNYYQIYDENNNLLCEIYINDPQSGQMRMSCSPSEIGGCFYLTGDFRLAKGLVIPKQTYVNETLNPSSENHNCIGDYGTKAGVYSFKNVSPSGDDDYEIGAPVQLPDAVSLANVKPSTTNFQYSILIPSKRPYQLDSVSMINPADASHYRVTVKLYKLTSKIWDINNYTWWDDTDLFVEEVEEYEVVNNLTEWLDPQSIQPLTGILVGIPSIRLANHILAPLNNIVVFDSITPTDL